MCHTKVGNIEAMNTLIQRGDSLNKTNVDGDTRLKLAASCGKLKILPYHTELDSELHVRDSTNNTDFHSVVFSFSMETEMKIC